MCFLFLENNFYCFLSKKHFKLKQNFTKLNFLFLYYPTRNLQYSPFPDLEYEFHNVEKISDWFEYIRIGQWRGYHGEWGWFDYKCMHFTECDDFEKKPRKDNSKNDALGKVVKRIDYVNIYVNNISDGFKKIFYKLPFKRIFLSEIIFNFFKLKNSLNSLILISSDLLVNFKINFSEVSTNKYINISNNFLKRSDYLFFFMRKNKIFNKGRYSRNRQTYRTGFYWCLWINIFVIYGLHYLCYRFTFTFGYL